MVSKSLQYGLVDENNILINTIIIAESDLHLLNQFIELHNAKNAYEITNIFDIELNKTYWNGEAFVTD